MDWGVVVVVVLGLGSGCFFACGWGGGKEEETGFDLCVWGRKGDFFFRFLGF